MVILVRMDGIVCILYVVRLIRVKKMVLNVLPYDGYLFGRRVWCSEK